MTNDRRRFLERLKRAAEVSDTLADKMIELVELREEVRIAEQVAAREEFAALSKHL